MCDFGPPPYKAINKLTNEEINFDTVYNVWYGDKNDITLPGLYHICATGSYYSYFDGLKWHEVESWEDKSEEYEFLREKIEHGPDEEYIMGGIYPIKSTDEDGYRFIDLSAEPRIPEYKFKFKSIYVGKHILENSCYHHLLENNYE